MEKTKATEEKLHNVHNIVDDEHVQLIKEMDNE